MKARVSNLIKTEAEWAKLNFKPMPGELVIYAPDKVFKYSRIKIGDGEHMLQDLPFVVESITEELLAAKDKLEISDAGRITTYII